MPFDKDWGLALAHAAPSSGKSMLVQAIRRQVMLSRDVHAGMREDCHLLPRLQAETWADGTARHAVAVAQSGGRALAVVATRPHGSVLPLVGGAWLVPNPSHHDRVAVLAAVHPRPPLTADMADIGLFGGGTGLAGHLASFLGGEPFAISPRGGDRYLFEGASHLLSSRGSGWNPGFRGPRTERSTRFLRPQGHGYPEPSEDGFRRPPDCRAIPCPGRGEPPGGILRRPASDWTASDAGLLALVRSTFGRLVDDHDRRAAACLGQAGWSAAAHALLADRGTAGERRRQAAALYPALAPLVVFDERTRGLVDAGRPFEDALRDAVAGMLDPDGAGGPTVAALRRLRTLPPAGFRATRLAARLATDMPVDWIPRDVDEWKALLDGMGPALSELEEMGLSVSDAVSHARGDWTGRPWASARRQAAGLAAGTGAPRVLNGASDMACRLADSLVFHAAASLGTPLEPAAGRRAAARILFGGRSLPAIDRAQLRWHAGLSRLAAALPDAVGNSWPGLLPPFTATNGLEVVFLADEAALKAEGMEGPDADGMDGLDHCVGGYGRQCFEGQSHVASVRRRVGDRTERVSTVEFAHEAGESRDPWARDGEGRRPNGTLHAEQHLALGNGDPPDDAVEAVDELVRLFHAGQLGPDPEAMRVEGRGTYTETYDWRVPGLMERAFEAWRPYLPRDVARSGLEGFVARVAEVGIVTAPPAPEGPSATSPVVGFADVR